MWLSGLFLFAVLLSMALSMDWLPVGGFWQRFGLQFYLSLGLLWLLGLGWIPMIQLDRRAALTIGVTLVVYFVGFAILDLLAQKFWGATAVVRPPFSGWFLPLIVAPLCEELFFRDLLYRTLKSRISRMILVLLITNIFFMVAHMTLHPGAFILGLICCGLVSLTGSVWPALLFHSLSNASWYFLPYFFPNFWGALLSADLLRHFYQ